MCALDDILQLSFVSLLPLFLQLEIQPPCSLLGGENTGTDTCTVNTGNVTIPVMIFGRVQNKAKKDLWVPSNMAVVWGQGQAFLDLAN